MNRTIAWFASNPVAANLLMLLMVVGGLFAAPALKQELIPEVSLDTVAINVVYPGASPGEVEEAVCVRVEEALHGLGGINHLRSTASEGFGVTTVQLLAGADVRRRLDEIRARVEAIDTFPDEVEEPEVKEITLRRAVLAVAVSGSADEGTLKSLGERVRDEISSLPGITDAELYAARPYEVSIEVSEGSLRRFGLRFDEVVQAVRNSSLDLPGGSLRTASGEILLRTRGQA
jgi:multidrug efflux pump subunit AcrB